MLVSESISQPITESDPAIGTELHDKATQTASPLRQFVDRAADTVAEKTESARESFSEFSSQITEKTEKTADAISERVGNAWNATTQTTQTAADRVSDVKDLAVGRVDAVGDRVDRFGHTLLETLANNFSDGVQNWIDSHPLWYWFWNHPVIFLLLIFLGLFLSLGLIQAIAGFSKEVVFWLLKSPFKLLRGGYRWATRSRSPFATTPLMLTPEERLGQLTARLEAVQEEQRQLLREISLELNGRKTRGSAKRNPPKVKEKRF